MARRAELTVELSRLFGNCVQTGPFAGMILPVASSWAQGEDRPARLLGTYESDLHASLLKAIGRAPDTIVNIGCAEGYYAVGMARLAPDAQVFAFDTDPAAQHLCGEAAAVNDVGGRVTVRGACSPAVINELALRPGHVLTVVDCDGGERELLDPVRAPGLARCDIIVETHDFVERGTTDMLEARFSSTHEIERIEQGGRNPNGIAALAHWPERDRWLLVDEDRPETMMWLACWARDRGPR